MIGKKFGYLTVIDKLPTNVVDTGRSKNWTKMMLCRCDCGVEIHVSFNHIRSGNTKSCGCYKKVATGDRKRTHGLSRSVEYSTWCKMKDRCYNMGIKDYKWYGAVGITVCKRWLISFENFLKDMGKRPSDKHSIERRNSKKNYTPINCYWGTTKEQSRNQSRTIRVKYNGEKIPLITLCERLNRPTSLVRSRLRAGWDLQSALHLPIQKRNLKKN